ncbi:MAG TPA: aspartyl protease family protein [Rhizomicrobium sp.]|nr:aspartyl protease family protein [Rhizomicrobium sp.]
MSRTLVSILLFSTAIAAPAFAATPGDILDANRTAMGDWSGKKTLKLEFAYSGQGLTGTTASIEDLATGAFVDSYDIPPTHGASGFDGTRAWEKEPSGTVTDQAGGDVVPLAISESYLDRNLWWRADRGGAAVESLAEKTAKDGKAYDVLKVAPVGGTAIEAWFDPKTHLLARTIQAQSTQTITTDYSDYAPADGAMIARKLVVDDGSGNLQTFTLVSAKFSAALPASAYRKPAENIHDFSIAGGKHETTVPFRLLNNHIYADVSVNGSKPLNFIFDTGGHSIVTPETAKALGLVSKGNLTSSGGGENLATSGVTTLKSIRVGDATITDQTASVLDFQAKGVEGADEQGMVGYEFFARFVTRFDYGSRTITFIDKKSFDPRGAGAPVPMRLYHQFPEILGSYDGVPGRFGIDTGSRMPLELNAAFAAKHGFRAKVTGGVEAMTGWGVGGPSRSLVFKGGTLKLGDVTIEHPLTMISLDKGGAGAAEAFPNNVGGGVLKRFVVTFDYDHSTMYLKPYEGLHADIDSFDRSGMWINAAPEGFKVVDITKGGPAEAAGLKKDDIITAVDSKPATGIFLPDLRKRLRNDKPGTVVTLAVKGKGEVKVTLRDLI